MEDDGSADTDTNKQIFVRVSKGGLALFCRSF